ncbi:DUF1652 domain-containing protein [Pseudomonas sp. MM211]|uniref:DUF1652 domain-containing protein n=1 Tax=Pseudomonas sp. MM211 TaxID=2866808 RepID=UPI001CECB34E|nr:DUF1652 domain-containing protein [Pseudomonas sp. MM211]UCJ14857.1 DUF1652 domain-containing protein [Pseudomonas sp. MM211]
MMSILEQRQIVESAFLPLDCRCSIEAGDTVSIQIRAPDDERVLLNAAGIDRSELSSSRSISQLVLRLRRELESANAADKPTVGSDPLPGVGARYQP